MGYVHCLHEILIKTFASKGCFVYNITMNTLKRDTLYSQMKPGSVYRRAALLSASSSLDRDLHTLVEKKKLKKLATGLYYRPKTSRFGALPPADDVLVKGVLNKPFLMYSWNDYNKLGLGLTQLYNNVVVYNSERHENKKLGRRIFSFKRPNNGFPSKLTKEFLLVDLLNNSKYLTEDVSQLKLKIKKNIDQFDKNQLMKLSKKFGKVGTKKYLQTLLEN